MGPRVPGILAYVTIAALVGCAQAANVADRRVLHADAASILFGDSSFRARALKEGSADPLTQHEVLLEVAHPHPTTPGLKQVKVQQLHQGLKVYGHYYVMGMEADGRTPVAEGTYGSIITGLDQAVPQVKPRLTEQEALSSASTDPLLAGATVVGHTAELAVWLQREDEVGSLDSVTASDAHLAYVLKIHAKDPNMRYPFPVTVVVDAMTGAVLKAWKERHYAGNDNSQVKRSTPYAQATSLINDIIAEEEDLTAAASTTSQPTTTSQPQALMQSLMARISEAASSSFRGLLGGRRSLLGAEPVDTTNTKRASSNVESIWGIGGNNKTGPRYFDGRHGFAPLQVTRKGDSCLFVNDRVKEGDVRHMSKADLGAVMTKVGKAYLTKNMTAYKEIHDFVNATTYPCPAAGQYIKTDDYVNTALSPEVDLHAYATQVFDMWQDWMKVDVIKEFKKKGVPTPLLVVPHMPAEDLDNAAWIGWMFYCSDGKYAMYPTCGGPDVISHELAHGVTELMNHGLVYYGAAGGWNEGFSDCAGAAFNQYLYHKMSRLIGWEVAVPDVLAYVIWQAYGPPGLPKDENLPPMPPSDGGFENHPPTTPDLNRSPPPPPDDGIPDPPSPPEPPSPPPINLSPNESYYNRPNLLSGIALRDMATPTKDGTSLESVKDFMASINPHFSSGIVNKMFWTLSQQPCWDAKTAMQVVQRAANLYFTSFITFVDSFKAMRRGAQDLGYPPEDVDAAWLAVDLWQACGDRNIEATFMNLPPPVDDEKGGWQGYAGETTYVGNFTYPNDIEDDINDVLDFLQSNYTEAYDEEQLNNVMQQAQTWQDLLDANYCGVSLQASGTGGMALGLGVFDMYVGINRVPDPDKGEYDCRAMGDATGRSGVVYQMCDVPLTQNTTYHLVLKGVTDWKWFKLKLSFFGPTRSLRDPNAKCFDHGACTKDSDCLSGACASEGHCKASKKPSPSPVTSAGRHHRRLSSTPLLQA